MTTKKLEPREAPNLPIITHIIEIRKPGLELDLSESNTPNLYPPWLGTPSLSSRHIWILPCDSIPMASLEETLEGQSSSYWSLLPLLFFITLTVWGTPPSIWCSFHSPISLWLLYMWPLGSKSVVDPGSFSLPSPTMPWALQALVNN